MTVSVAQLQWAAGLMEGEGCFGIRRGHDLVAELTMTDSDVVEKFASIFGFGTISTRLLPSGKTAYHWTAVKQSHVAGLFMTLMPLMGKRRQNRIIECLALWKQKALPKRMWSKCKNGHPLSGDNLKVVTEGKYQKRRCVECAKLRQRKYRATTAPDQGAVVA